MARALKVPGNRLRLRTPPDSGGSFGVKQGVFPYIVLMALAARVAGRAGEMDRGPARASDRLGVGHQPRHHARSRGRRPTAASRALAWDQVEDVGAHIRAPEPATLYRMHGNLTGAYDIRNVAVRNRVVLTNKTPTGLNRGFGGPQVYYALERLMQRIAVELELDPLDVIRRNLVPRGAFPIAPRPAALLDSGDYPAPLRTAVDDGGLAELAARRDAGARRGPALRHRPAPPSVEPSVSNMGYITTVLTPEERRKAGPKNGAQATATISLDPLGAVSVHVASVPQGQGHRTVLAQVVADALGLDAVGHPRHRRYRYRARRLVDRIRQLFEPLRRRGRRRRASRGDADEATSSRAIAAAQLNVPADEIEFAGGTRARAAAIRTTRCRSDALAAASHWSPGTLADDDAGAPRDRVLDAAAARPRRPRTTTSTPRSATASSSISAASRSTASPARCASTNTSPCTTAAACCIPAWSRARSPAASRRRSAPRSTRNSPTRDDGSFLSGTLRRLSGADHDGGARRR